MYSICLGSYERDVRRWLQSKQTAMKFPLNTAKLNDQRINDAVPNQEALLMLVDVVDRRERRVLETRMKRSSRKPQR